MGLSLRRQERKESERRECWPSLFLMFPYKMQTSCPASETETFSAIYKLKSQYSPLGNPPDSG
jgi:hypothetical protein